MAAPLGNKNAAKAKQWSAAIERALDARGAGDRLKALDALAERLLTKCDEADMQALKELGDRIDGKAVQHLDANLNATLSLLDALRQVNEPGSHQQAEVPTEQPG